MHCYEDIFKTDNPSKLSYVSKSCHVPKMWILEINKVVTFQLADLKTKSPVYGFWLYSKLILTMEGLVFRISSPCL